MQGHESWFLIAKEDLGLATVALREKFYNGCTYHTQQAAEKVLKGYQCFKKHKLVKTHNLVALLDICSTEYDFHFITLKPAIVILQPYSTQSRYPGDDYITIEKKEAATALEAATLIYNFTYAKIAAESKL